MQLITGLVFVSHSYETKLIVRKLYQMPNASSSVYSPECVCLHADMYYWRQKISQDFE